MHTEFIVLIVAECNVNLLNSTDLIFTNLVLIVAECNVNYANLDIFNASLEF